MDDQVQKMLIVAKGRNSWQWLATKLGYSRHSVYLWRDGAKPSEKAISDIKSLLSTELLKTANQVG